MSTRPVVFNLVNCIIGVSVLAMPFCFQECGIVLCAVAIAFSAWLTKKSCSLLLKAGQIARRRNYEGLALSTYGAPGKLAVEISIIGLLIGSLIAFNVIIGDLVPSIFHNLSGVEVTWTVRAILMTLLAFGVGLPLSMMRNLKSLSSFSAISLFFYAFFVVQIIFSALPSIVEGSWIYNLNYWRPEKLLNYVPIFALAFACQPQLFALYETLPDPSVKHMEGVVDTGINVVALVYFLVGLFGYVCFYNVGVQGDMLNNYGKTFTSYVIKVGFVMSVIVSFPLMVYPLRASLHSLIFSESSSSENLPGGSGFIQPDRFTYLTLTIISGTLVLGILFPQVEFVLALTGATMGTLIAFVFPSCLFLRAVSEKTNTRLIAKLVLLLGSVCFIAGTYTVLTKQESGHQHHQVDIHPPGIDPIKPMALHDSLQNVNHTNIQGGIKAAPVDVDVAKIGLGGGIQPGDDKLKVVANDGQSIEAQAADVKPADAVENEGLKRAEEPVKPGEGEEKRQEPAVPHAPQDNPAQGAPDQRKNEDGHLNEKRQLMSQGVEEKPANTNDQAVKAPARNAADTNQVKVSEQEIDEELKKLEHSDKVSLPDGKDKEQDDAALHKDEPQDGKEISLVKRDLQSQDSTSLGNGKVESGKAVEARKSHDVSHKAVNQSDSHKMDKLESLPDPLKTRISLGINNRTAVKKGYEVMNSIKMRDLKSNSKLNGKQSSSLSSKSFKTLLSKSSSRRTKRSSLQGKGR